MLSKGRFNSFFIIILGFILPLFLQGHHQRRRYVHRTQQKTWSEAQRYCREHHIDLATFRSLAELNRVSGICNVAEKCWIGLHRDDNDTDVWNWSDGEKTRFESWHHNNSQMSLDKNCVVTANGFYYNVKCDQPHAFLCSEENLILVKENKTWEEALEHCRTLGTDHNSANIYYDLPNMHTVNKNWNARRMIKNAQTEEVWIGLRYLAGHWLWVNGGLLNGQFPACPATGMYCGTMLKTGDLLSEVNCLERRNFFCSK